MVGRSRRLLLLPLQMGCYGLGPTRLMAASVEALSTEDNIRWPRAIAPLVAAVIPPKEGSKEQGVTQLAMDLADQLASSITPHVALDDRTRSTIGYRLNSLRNIGVPFAIIVAKKALEPMPRFEVVDIYKDQTHFLNHTDTLQFFQSLSNIR
ncbi:PARS2 [Cordylochernes scorpioides]|uniref:PARS2 n=1 Tax=Cordylochernes scorpioides TaxID=51811 RepID=A0ABY6KI94_9ARAC|nr:PARS2 [Cordylochernes scorpioides]